MADLKYITIRAEIIDDETAVIRGVDFQYMISRSDLERAEAWDRACSRMLGDLVQRMNGRKQSDANKRDPWTRQAETWCTVLRMRAKENRRDVRQFPAAVVRDWPHACERMLTMMRARSGRQSMGEWAKWGMNKNIGKRASRSVE